MFTFGFSRLPLGIESMDPEQVFRTESELFWDERRMFFCQNRTPIVEIAMNSFGGASESGRQFSARTPALNDRYGSSISDYKAKAREDSAKLAQLSQFVGGKTFYAKGDQWMDSEVQKRESAARVRVKFGSPEYFELIRKTPRALSWASLGKNVQFVWEEKVYEIFD